MTTATSEELLSLADDYAKIGNGWGDPTYCAECRIVANALRRLAEAEGQEAKPVAEQVGWAYRCRTWAEDVWHLCGRRPNSVPGREIRPVFLGSPPPAPGYAEGRRDGLEEAAIEWRNARTVVCRKGALASQEEWARLGAAETALAHEIAIGPVARRRALNKDSTDA